MLNLSLPQVAQWLLTYKYAVLAPFMVVEGPIVTVIAGFLASQGYLNAYIVYGVAVMGDLVGDLIYYVIGHLGRRRFLRKGSFLGINRERMTALEEFYDLHSGKTFLFGKWTQSFGFAILMAAGIASVPLGKYILLNILGTLPKSLLFLLIGYYFGKHYESIGVIFNQVGLILAVVAAIALVIFFYVRHKKNKNQL